MAKIISLTQGMHTIVDDDKYEWLSQCKWHAFEGCAGNFYAYASRQVFDGKKHKRIIMHRLLLPIQHGFVVDHINGNGLDNRMQNLRLVTRSQSCMNRGVFRNNKSGVTGVHWHKQHKKWYAGIQKDRKSCFLGLFDNLADAINARRAAEANIFAEYRREK